MATVTGYTKTETDTLLGSKADTSAVPTVGAAGSGASNALSANDPTTTNARTPTAHAASHEAGGSDVVTVSVSQVSATGTASSTTYLRGDGTWSTPAGGGGALPAGGTTGQVLEKLSATDGDAGWANAVQLAVASSGEDPVAPGTANVGTQAVAARADHVHPSSGLFSDYGDGSDGALILDGATAIPSSANMTRSGTTYTLYNDINASSVTLSAGITIKTNGFRFNVNGPLNGPSGGTPAVISAPQGSATGSSAPSNPGSQFVSIGPGAPGVAGGTGAGTAGAAPANGYRLASGAGGGAGGGSGATAGGAASTVPGMGAAGGSVGAGQIPFGLPMLRSRPSAFSGISAYMNASAQSSGTGSNVVCGGASGGSGAGDGTNAGGAGGWGGWVLIVNARTVSGNITVTAPGGNGGPGAGGNAGGGGGGGGGTAILNTTDSTGFTGTVTAPGGTGGAAAGTGVAGTTGGTGFAALRTWS
jgi:hypothetical protein